MLGALLDLAVLGVELMAFGVHFDSFCSICAPFPGLLISLVIDVELVQEGLGISFFLDG